MQRGFTFTGHAEQMSRLNVGAASLDGYDGIEERLHREGIRIVTLAEVETEESFLRAVHAVDLEASRDVPSSEVFTGIPYDVWLKHLSGPGRSPESFWIAMDGDTPVGVATLERRGMNAAFNGFTGVARSHRGRGVARALKLKTIEWARSNGVDFIYTGNHVDNKRMLDINIRLGYKPLPRFLEVVKVSPRQRPDLHVATDWVSDL
jgi:GNAT superfamily N-acetyltransferase